MGEVNRFLLCRYMNWINFGKYGCLPIGSTILILLFFLFNGCGYGDSKEKDRAIALVQNYQINNKSVSERMAYALGHSTHAKIETIEWNALRTQKNIYEVTCTVKIGNRERYFKWWANLSSNRISPLNMDTQEIHGGGFY